MRAARAIEPRQVGPGAPVESTAEWPTGRATLVVFFASFTILASGAFVGLPFGKAVVGGLRVLDGDLPYRDFWTIYAPGQFYAVAAVLGLFGREVAAQGVVAAGLLAAALALEFRLAARLGAPTALAGGLSLALDAIVAHRAAEVPGVGATLLDDYLRETFEPVLEIDECLVMRRRDAPAP